MIDRYPGATWVPADPSNYRRAGRPAFSRVIIHITDGRPAAMPVAQMWQVPKHGSSAHFVVGQDGTVLQCVALGDVAWHAHAQNGAGVGIEHCARTPRELSPLDPGLEPSDAQYAASAKLVAWLCDLVGLPRNRFNIQGHAEADPATTHLDCPLGSGWDWDRYMALVLAA